MKTRAGVIGHGEFVIGHPVALLENNRAVFRYQDGSAEILPFHHRAYVGVHLLCELLIHSFSWGGRAGVQKEQRAEQSQDSDDAIAHAIVRRPNGWPGVAEGWR